MANKDSRIKHNLVSSVISQIVLISLGFLIPRLYLENFGSEVNGVLSTIKQIFAYMTILEAGIGLTSEQALYKKIGLKDYKRASEVLAATNIYYKKTGVAYLIVTLVIAFIYAYAIPTSIDSIVLFFIIILSAIPSLFFYFVLAKYRVIMEVDGRHYVINNSEIILQLASNAGKLIVLLLTDSLILIQLVYCLIALIRLVYLYFYGKLRYKWLDLKAKPDFAAISQKNSVLVHQLSAMVFNNTDIILISSLCDFKAASVYSIYNLFFFQMQNFIVNLSSSYNFALGQMFHIDREKFNKVFTVYETLYIMTTHIIYTLMAVFLLPLIQIYTKGIDDAEYTNEWLLFLFVVMNLLVNSKVPVSSIVNYSGDFEETRPHSVWEMIINIAVSIVAILYMGISGAILGTIVALLYRNIVAIYYSNKYILKRSQVCTYRVLISNASVFAIIMTILFVDSFNNSNFLHLLLKGLLHSTWIVVLYLIVNFAFSRAAFKTIFESHRERKNQRVSQE